MFWNLIVRLFFTVTVTSGNYELSKMEVLSEVSPTATLESL